METVHLISFYTGVSICPTGTPKSQTNIYYIYSSSNIIIFYSQLNLFCTVVDMCKSSFATEEANAGGHKVDSVV
jgi:hypothetical protein